MPHARMKNLPRERGVHKSTGGIPPAIPGPVDPVDAAPPVDFEHSRSPAFFRGRGSAAWRLRGCDAIAVTRR